MANFYGTWRTNYVKWNPEMLEALSYLWYVEVIQQGDLSALISCDDGGAPSMSLWNTEENDPYRENAKLFGIDTETDDDQGYDLEDYIHLALAPEDNLIIQSIGNEKARYVMGYAHHVTHEGIQNSIHLDSIMQFAPAGTTECSY